MSPVLHNTDPTSPHPDSDDLSDPQPPSPAESSTSIESDPEADDPDVESPDSGSDEDAEGSDDEDFDITLTNRSRPVAAQSDRSSSSAEPSRKRKLSVEYEDDINNNPELYGLRRSVSILATFPSETSLISLVASLQDEPSIGEWSRTHLDRRTSRTNYTRRSTAAMKTKTPAQTLFSPRGDGGGRPRRQNVWASQLVPTFSTRR